MRLDLFMSLCIGTKIDLKKNKLDLDFLSVLRVSASGETNSGVAVYP